jgi:ATPase subunit of ABC transporter with duplicated ATPase domains
LGTAFLAHVSLDLNRGEVLGLVGENGVGKSTLMNILFGIWAVLLTDFVERHFAKKVVPVKIEEILTDSGREYSTWHEETMPTHEFEKTCNRLGIKHAMTKLQYPWTNGYAERLNNTLLSEFCVVAFRKKR